MMHRDRLLAPSGPSTDSAAVAVPLQNLLAESTEVHRIMPAKGIAGGTVTVGTDLLSSAPAVERALHVSLQNRTPVWSKFGKQRVAIAPDQSNRDANVLATIMRVPSCFLKSSRPLLSPVTR